ncbi:3TM-type holin [Bowmanella sp. JS7-9]|uniref:3TM-type holin n=2 Tax=Pseudobowmanella zhangzhouensis TaxID=1537679 RepID=A0ABW1XLT9_9ALTE|nr:3TM-type holin [Bowmanella sp. JS7-9]
MVPWLTSLLKGGLGSLVSDVANVADRFITTDEDKQRFAVEMETLIQKRESEMEQTLRANLQAKERILVAELSQGDTYTKRARPTVVYFGLFIIFINYVVVPLVNLWATGAATPFDLPSDFWAAWGGIVATWSLGRSYERASGNTNKLSRLATGSSESQWLK